MDFRIAAVVSAHPELEKYWLMRYRRVMARRHEVGSVNLGHDPLWYGPKNAAFALWEKIGCEDIGANNAYVAWREYFILHGALHTWNNMDMLTWSLTENEAISSTEDSV